jgi:hypothetical protein
VTVRERGRPHRSLTVTAFRGFVFLLEAILAEEGVRVRDVSREARTLYGEPDLLPLRYLMVQAEQERQDVIPFTHPVGGSHRGIQLLVGLAQGVLARNVKRAIHPPEPPR